MILTRLKDHLVANGRCSQRQLMQKFGISGDGVDAMLAVWVKKGKVSKSVTSGRNNEIVDVYYRWNQDNELAITTLQ